MYTYHHVLQIATRNYFWCFAHLGQIKTEHANSFHIQWCHCQPQFHIKKKKSIQSISYTENFHIFFINTHNMSRLMIKPTKWPMRPAKTQISLGIRPVWSESLLSTWRKLGSLATHWAHNKDSEQTGKMPRLIRVFDGCTVMLLVLSCGGSYNI